MKVDILILLCECKLNMQKTQKLQKLQNEYRFCSAVSLKYTFKYHQYIKQGEI